MTASRVARDGASRFDNRYGRLKDMSNKYQPGIAEAAGIKLKALKLVQKVAPSEPFLSAITRPDIWELDFAVYLMKPWSCRTHLLKSNGSLHIQAWCQRIPD